MALSNSTLHDELVELAAAADRLAKAVDAKPDLPPRVLAAALVEAAKLGDKLTRLAGQVEGDGKRKR
jgi:hypothetical protein